MKKLILFSALAVLAGASLVQAQPGVGFYHNVYLLDTLTSVDKGDWNAVCMPKNTDMAFWVVGDSGEVRRFDVTKGPSNKYVIGPNPAASFNLGSCYTLTDVCFYDQSRGWIVGYKDSSFSYVGESRLINIPAPGRGQIWYTTDGGNIWHDVDTANMPPEFYQGDAVVPFLSVDFSDYLHGFVGCGCGFLLKSDDGGQSWYIDPDKEDRQWWDVGPKIGSIPRDMTADSFYNHYADWYWDVKANNNPNDVYLASDNNGVFFHSPDQGRGGTWNVLCFGQPPEDYYNGGQLVKGYGTENVPYVYEDAPTSSWNADSMCIDTSLEVLSVGFYESDYLTERIVLGSMRGKVFYQDGNGNWHVDRLLGGSQTWPDNPKDIVMDTCLWLNGIAVRYDTSENRFIEGAGSYGTLATNATMWGQKGDRLQWYSYRYCLNDVASGYLWYRPGFDTIHMWSLSVGDHGALLAHNEGYILTDTASEEESLMEELPGFELTVEDPSGDQEGGTVTLEVSSVPPGATKFNYYSYMVPDRDNCKPTWKWYRPLSAYERYPIIIDTPSTSVTLPRAALVGHGNIFAATTAIGGNSYIADACNNEAGMDDIAPEGKTLITLQGGEFIDWPDSAFQWKEPPGSQPQEPDSLMVRISWREPEDTSDISLAGYFVCPVEVTGSFSPAKMEITYTYWPPYLPYTHSLGDVTVQVQDTPTYDPLYHCYILPKPPAPAFVERRHHIVHTAPLRRNVWQSSGGFPDDPQHYAGAYYSILPVDYSGNVDPSEFPGDGWSPWFFVPYYPTHAGISEPGMNTNVPFALEILKPAITANSTTIRFSLPADAEVSLNLFDAAGRRVKSIHNGKLEAGCHTNKIHFVDDKGQRLSDGVYFIKYISEERSVSEKIVVVE
ncbi:hypothetical protein JXM67_03135 [candidate division WOR-3 bacterium]|nr:hypothetical protein [candidate division WOR-3 bacterium]